MALGVDADGREVKNVKAQLIPLLQGHTLSTLDKQRLLMMYFIDLVFVAYPPSRGRGLNDDV